MVKSFRQLVEDLEKTVDQGPVKRNPEEPTPIPIDRKTEIKEFGEEIDELCWHIANKHQQIICMIKATPESSNEFNICLECLKVATNELQRVKAIVGG